jgi:hypothetical protein
VPREEYEALQRHAAAEITRMGNQVHELTKAREHIFNVARQRREILKRHGLWGKDDKDEA